MSTSLDNFPKLKDVTPEGPLFNLKCPECSSKNIELKPISVNWRNQESNQDLGKAVSRFYDNLPTLQEAIIIAISQQKGILVSCHDCKKVNSVLEHVERTKVGRWLDKRKEEQDGRRANNSDTKGNTEKTDEGNQTTNIV